MRRDRRLRRALQAVAVSVQGALVTLAASAASAACPTAMPTPAGEAPAGAASAVPVTADALLRLSDIKGFAPSPDGRWVFLVVQQADPERNAYKVQWLLQAADCAGASHVMDRVGRPPLGRTYGLIFGSVSVEAPAWSPDGRFVAYRKSAGDQTELWVADMRRGQARRVDTGEVDVEAFAWRSKDVLLFRPGLDWPRYRASREAERRQGFIYDDRFFVSSGVLRPMIPDCAARPSDEACAHGLGAVEMSSDALRARTATEAEVAGSSFAPSVLEIWKARDRAGPANDHAALVRVGPDGRRAWAENVDPVRFKGLRPPRRVRSDAPTACAAAACVGQVEGLWWAEGGRTVLFLKRESGAGRLDDSPRDITGLYRWDVGSGRVQTVFRTSDALDHCAMAGETALLCLHETSRTPARILRIDIAGGAHQVVLDPNPGFAVDDRIQLRKVHFTDAAGNAGYYYVVWRRDLPQGPAPAVIVQYRARGFLRGGVGDEYPIFPLAERGFVVLAFDQADDPLQTRTPGPMPEQVQQRGIRAQSLESAVDALAREGLVDRERVALTGLSSGSETLHYALQRGARFAAAIASTGALELDMLAITPPLYRDLKPYFGARRLFEADGVLAELAWSVRPEQLRTPLLVNVTEGEFLKSVEGFAALRDARRPLEVRVFPDTGLHTKYDPANRAAVYRLNEQWLAYWLLGERSGNPAWADQYRKWDAMRAQLASERATASR